MRWMEWLPSRRRRKGLRGVQWNLDDFESMEEALSAADALTEAGIYSVVSETETGPVILVSRSDLPAASKVLAKFRE